MPYTPINDLPPAPQRVDDPDTFVAKADAHVAALTPWTNEVNAAGAYFDAVGAEIDLDKQAAEDAQAAAELAQALSEEWATSDAVVDATDYSAKEYAIGVNVPAGSAKDWATEIGTQVDGVEYSAKEYAVGAVVPEGSAKDWATETGAQVNGTEYSAKEYAIGVVVPEGSSKQWAVESEDVEVTTGLYSSRHYALKSEGFKDSAEAAAAAVQSAAGLPSLVGNAGKSLVVNTGETGVEWGSSGPKNYAVQRDSNITVSTGLVSTDISSLIRGPVLYSTDGINYIVRNADFSENVTGGVYLKGLGPFQTIDRDAPLAGAYAAPYSMYYDGTNLFAGYYGKIESYIGLSTTVADTYTNAGLITGIAYDGANLWASQSITPKLLKFTGKDLSSTPTEYTLPISKGNMYGLCYDGANLLLQSSPPSLTNLSRIRMWNSGSTITGAASNGLIQLDLGTAYDPDTMVVAGSYNWNNVSGNISDFVFSSDGTKGAILAGNTIYGINFSTPWELHTGTLSGHSQSVSGQEASALTLGVNGDGTKFFVSGADGDDLNEYTLSVGWDFSSTFTFVDATSWRNLNAYGFWTFNSDGTKIYARSNSGAGYIAEYTLTAYDASTLSGPTNRDLSTYSNNNANSILFNSDGTKVWLSQGGHFDSVTLSTGFDLTSATSGTLTSSIHSAANRVVVYTVNTSTGALVDRYTQHSDLSVTYGYHLNYDSGSGIYSLIPRSASAAGLKCMFTSNITDGSYDYSLTQLELLSETNSNATAGFYGVYADSNYQYCFAFDVNNNNNTYLYDFSKQSTAIVFGG